MENLKEGATIRLFSAKKQVAVTKIRFIGKKFFTTENNKKFSLIEGVKGADDYYLNWKITPENKNPRRLKLKHTHRCVTSGALVSVIAMPEFKSEWGEYSKIVNENIERFGIPLYAFEQRFKRL